MLILASALVLSYFKVPVMWISFSYVLGGLVTFWVNMLFIRKLGVGFKVRPDPVLIKQLLVLSLPLGLMFLFSQINFKVDAILISVMNLPANLGLNNTESVAVYGLPYKIFEVSLVVPTFFMNAVYPVLILHMQEGKGRLKGSFIKVFGFLIGSGMLFSVLGFFLAPLAVSLLGGSEFSQSVLVLRILLGGLFLFYATQPISWLIVTLGYQKYLPLVYLVSAVFNVSANLIFIPVYSFYGSAVITLFSEVIILLLLIFFAHKSWKLRYA